LLTVPLFVTVLWSDPSSTAVKATKATTTNGVVNENTPLTRKEGALEEGEQKRMRVSSFNGNHLANVRN
jgi:hypothetical protein